MMIYIEIIVFNLILGKMDYEKFPPWVPRKRGHWLQSLNLAKSSDGLHFTKLNRAVVEVGGATSNIITDTDKERIVAIFHYYSFEKEEDFNKIAVSFSYNKGETWTKPHVINLEAPEVVQNHACDPALIPINDGKYRLYFAFPEPQEYEAYPNVYPASRILSAISDDCINFNIEKGIRFMVEGEIVNDPSIIKIEDKWHYYSPFLVERGKNYHAVSEDGLNFTRVDDIILEMKMLGCALAVDNGYRFYSDRTAFSKDGYKWIQEDIKTLGPDPGVVRLKDGSYLMLYTAGHE